ncbi:MAG TPA: oligopeptide:H+ symporter [Polyangiaceae bacterium]|nr:oligopeptide:H+ symporter [Polyangiaceae bacterium]
MTATREAVLTVAPASGSMPRQIPFIIATEGCERFSFYGMRNILTSFLVSSLLLYLPAADRPSVAKEVFHSFVIGVYFFPLLGGWLSDRFFGKYNTTLWFSLIYCAGHACLAAFDDNRTGFYTGLFLIALGSGGIKPLVTAFVGDQFDKTNKHRAKVVYDAFYWIINFGSFFASFFMPIFLRHFGGSVAFGIPGVLMFVATVVFFAGRKRYVICPPSPPNPDSFLNVVGTALLARVPGQSRPGLILAVIGALLALGSLALLPEIGFIASFCLALVLVMGFFGSGAWMQLERARAKHGDEATEGVRAVLRLLVVFALVTPFWSLFDQKASTWILQADKMTKPDWFQSSQMQALNPALVMILIPFNNAVLYPLVRRAGYDTSSALRRMTVGLVFPGIAWIIVGATQLVIESGVPVSITWQMLPYAFLTFGEILVVATAYEFSYSQAPASMKGVLMAFFLLTTTVGNLWVLLVNASVKSDAVTARIASTGVSVTAFQMFFFAGFALVSALAFALYARSYDLTDHYRASEAA